jgi:hypothetical protein
MKNTRVGVWKLYRIGRNFRVYTDTSIYGVNWIEGEKLLMSFKVLSGVKSKKRWVCGVPTGERACYKLKDNGKIELDKNKQPIIIYQYFREVMNIGPELRNMIAVEITKAEKEYYSNVDVQDRFSSRPTMCNGAINGFLRLVSSVKKYIFGYGELTEEVVGSVVKLK